MQPLSPRAQGARLVTPEAVVLDVQTAGLGSRVFARAIDLALQAAGLILVLIAASALGTAGLVVALIAVTVIAFAYPIISETLWRGRTIGKAAFGLRVVTRQGAPIRFRHALVRGLIGLGEVMTLPVVAVVAMLVSPLDQRLGDMAAGTVVIRERASGPPSWPVVFSPPPGWESFVESLDVSAMTAGEYETVRAFLLRAHEMATVPRTNLALRLAGPLATRWHQPVPPGAAPEFWLACVASAYQRRHTADFVPAAAPPPAPGMVGPAGWYGRPPGSGPSAWSPHPTGGDGGRGALPAAPPPRPAASGGDVPAPAPEFAPPD